MDRWKHIQTCSLVFLLCLVVYIITLRKTVPGGDAGELIAEACALGTPHPPGYPLLTMLTAGAIRWTPSWLADASPAYRANLLSAIFGAGTASILAAVVARGVKWASATRPQASTYAALAAVGTAAAFALSPRVWQYSTSLEVFSLNNLLCSAVLWQLQTFCLQTARASGALQITPEQPVSPGTGGGERGAGHKPLADGPASASATPPTHFGAAMAGAFLAGLALTNQHTSVLFIAPAIVWVMWRFCLVQWRHARNHGVGSLRACVQAVRGFLVGTAQCAAMFAAGLLPYLYLPVADAMWPRAGSWGDVQSFRGLVRHIARVDYGTFRLHASDIPRAEGTWERVMACVADAAWTQHGLVWLPLVIVGVGAAVTVPWAGHSIASSAESHDTSSRGASVTHGGLTRHERRARSNALRAFCVLCGVLWAVYMAVFHALSNTPLDDPLLYGVHARFWMQPLLPLVILAGLGAAFALTWVSGFSARSPRSNKHSQSTAPAPRSNSGPRWTLWLGWAAVAVLTAHLASVGPPPWALAGSRADGAVERWGRGVLASVPKGSILLASDDLTWGSVSYLQECEGLRQDVTFLNTPLLSHLQWSPGRRHRYSDVVFPGAALVPTTSPRRRPVELPPSPPQSPQGNGGRWQWVGAGPEPCYSLADLIAANIGRRPVYATPGTRVPMDKDAHLLDYTAVPVGLVERLLPKAKRHRGQVGIRAVLAPRIAAKWLRPSLRRGVWARVDAVAPAAALPSLPHQYSVGPPTAGVGDVPGGDRRRTVCSTRDPAHTRPPPESWDGLVARVYWEGVVRNAKWVIQELGEAEERRKGKVPPLGTKARAAAELQHNEGVVMAVEALDAAWLAGAEPAHTASALKDIGLCYYTLAGLVDAMPSLRSHPVPHSVVAMHSPNQSSARCMQPGAQGVDDWRRMAYGRAAAVWGAYLDKVDKSEDPHVGSIVNALEFARRMAA